MTDKEFTFWLQGYFEISGATEIDEKSAGIIQDKLQSVFHKRTSVDGHGGVDTVNPVLRTGSGGSGGTISGTTFGGFEINPNTNILPQVC